MVQIAYLSVPSPGKWILDIFGTHIFRSFFRVFFCPRRGAGGGALRVGCGRSARRARIQGGDTAIGLAVGTAGNYKGEDAKCNS